MTFGGTSVGAANFKMGSEITTTVPPGATGKVCVTTPGGSRCSSADFTVTEPPPVSYVQQIGSVTDTGPNAQQSLSVTVGAGGVAAGDTIVIGVASDGATAVNGANDDAGNTYHVDVSRQYAGSGQCTAALISAAVTTALSQGQKITVTVSSGKAWGFTADEWRGPAGVVDRTGASDSGGVAGTNVSVSTAAATTSASEAVVAATCIGAQPTLTAGAGYTLSADLPITFTASNTTRRKLGAEYDISSSTGTQTATFTLGTTRNWSAVIATYGRARLAA